MKAAVYLQQAADLIDGDRHRQHGDRATNIGNCAQGFGFWLDIRRNQQAPLTRFDACVMMGLSKLARTQSGEFNADDMRDALGWFAMAAEFLDPANAPTGILNVDMPELASVEAKTRA